MLAVSAGSGILVGAGIRLAEKQRKECGGTTAPVGADLFDALSERIEAIEQRLDGREATTTERHSAAHQAPERSLEAAEKRLMRRTEEQIDALAKSIQERIESRLDPLEAELAVQRSSVAELREYSLRTERSLQKLLEGVDKLVSVQTSHHDREGRSRSAAGIAGSGIRA